MPGTSTGGESRRALQVPREWFRAWWQRRVPFAISVGLTAFALTIYAYTFIGDRPTAVFSFINRLELDALDLRFRLRPDRYKHPDPRIIIVDIDQRSQEILGRWPFSRTYFAQMLDALREDGAKVAAFDVTFSKPDETAAPIRELRQTVIERQKQGGQTDPRVIADLDRLSKEYDGDEQFARAIERFGNVVLGNFFLYSEYDLKGVDDKTLDRYANILADFPFPQVRAANPQTGERDLQHLIQGFGEPYALMPKGTQANIEILSDALRNGARRDRIFQRGAGRGRRRAPFPAGASLRPVEESGRLGPLRLARRAGRAPVSRIARPADGARFQRDGNHRA